MNILNTSGLNDAEVSTRRLKHGLNVISKSHNRFGSILLEVIKEPMFILLVAISFIYFAAGQTTEGIIMLVAILMVSLISIYQQVRSEKAVSALAGLSQPLSTVIRNGIKQNIPSEEIVPGDILIVNEGEFIPADANIISGNDFSVNESILTGESFPVLKGENDKYIYSGTTVASGSATTEVTATGNATRVGKLGILLQQIEKEKTLLQIQVKTFVNRMALFGFLAFAVVFIYNYTDTRSWLESLMHGLTIAMAVLPEEIPVALSTFMALGAYRMIKNNVIAKHPQTVEALGSATVICIDKTGTVTENKMKVSGLYDYAVKKVVDPLHFGSRTAMHLLQTAFLASEKTPFDPMEAAIHDAYHASADGSRYEMIKEYPLSGHHPIMTHIYKEDGGKIIITCKGAPEGILEHSVLTVHEKRQVLNDLKSIASTGSRVLAVADAQWDRQEWPDNQFEFTWNFLGFVILNDPPKQNMAGVIQGFYQAGIRVIMITGDYPETACAIADQIGIRNAVKYSTADEINVLDASALRQKVQEVNVFARTPPEMKLKIINALKENGEVVAMTGDGVNDAPALKAAHIGIAMGRKGSDVARSAASLVLVNDDLSGMVTAVALGRKIFSNLKKAIQYIITIHIPLISIVTIPLILGWKFPNIFSPVHVIFLELIMGPTCSIAYENEPLDRRLLVSTPNKFTSMLFSFKELSMSVLQGSVITLALLCLLYYSIKSGYDATVSRTFVFTTLIFSNIFLTLTGRSKIETMFETIRYKNYHIPLIILLTLGILALALLHSGWQRIFQLTSLSIIQIGTCMGTAMIAVLWIDLYKLLYMRGKREK